MEGHLAFSLSNGDKIDYYKNLLYKIYKMMNEVKKLEIDTSEYELKLKTIEDEVNQSGFTANHKKRLEDLEKVLNIYAFYQEALYNCRYVSLKISKDNTLEEINNI